jgi:putative ABC transport system permease protein
MRCLGTIAAISLLLGGIGVMNIMVTTVAERTREIAIRRALGAKRWHIACQFLMESVFLSAIGGILGVFLGMALCRLATHLIAYSAVVQTRSPILAFAVSLVVGLIFGAIPARRAAHLDPIEPLRHK